MIFYRIYQFIIMLPLMIVITVLASLIVVIGSLLGGGRVIGFYPSMVWARCMAWLTLVRVEVRGRDNVAPGRSYIFVANHQGAYDIFAIYGWLGHNFVWMMKKSLEKIPLVGYACLRAGHIYVDRRSPSAVHATMVTAEKRIAEGRSVVVFPEGTRSRNGKLGVFKRGAYALAQEFNLPVVPITIDGAYDVMPIGHRLPRPGRIILTIHHPIEAPAEGHDMTELIARSREAIASALPERLR